MLYKIFCILFDSPLHWFEATNSALTYGQIRRQSGCGRDTFNDVFYRIGSDLCYLEASSRFSVLADVVGGQANPGKFRSSWLSVGAREWAFKEFHRFFGERERYAKPVTTAVKAATFQRGYDDVTTVSQGRPIPWRVSARSIFAET